MKSGKACKDEKGSILSDLAFRDCTESVLCCCPQRQSAVAADVQWAFHLFYPSGLFRSQRHIIRFYFYLVNSQNEK